jgi:hypothetical protein
MVVGIIGFFTVAALVNAVVLEVRGQDALGAAFVLLIFAALLAWVLQKRWRIFDRR